MNASSKRKNSSFEPSSTKRTNTECNKSVISCSDDVDECMKSIFALVKEHEIQFKIPAIIWKHQLYALCNNRTKVDRRLNELCEEATIRFFKLGSTVYNYETAIVSLEDYEKYLRCNWKSNAVDKFLLMVKECPQTTFTTSEMDEYSITENQRTELVRNGLLAVHRTVGTWLLSVPSCGHFVKTFVSGRNALISYIKRSKFGEILQSELEKKKVPKVQLNLEYHILDLIGSDSVQRIESDSGTILRV